MTTPSPLPTLNQPDQDKGRGSTTHGTGGIQAILPSIFGPAKQEPPEMKGQTVLVTGGAQRPLDPWLLPPPAPLFLSARTDPLPLSFPISSRQPRAASASRRPSPLPKRTPASS